MQESEGRPTSVSSARSLQQVADYWDTHSLSDHWEQTAPVEIEVGALRKTRVTIDPDLYAQLLVHARRRGLSTETVVNLWIAERLREPTSAKSTVREQA